MEIDKKLCKVCNELKFRIRKGRYPGGRGSRFVNELDQAWNGRTCPTCHNKHVAIELKKKRDVNELRRKGNIGVDSEPQQDNSVSKSAV